MVLFVTRKYPPNRGGMEEFSARLYEALPSPKELIALRGRQWRLPAFGAQTVLAAVRHRRSVEQIHLGDALLTPLAPLLERLTGLPVSATLHGQDTVRRLQPYRAVVGSALRRLDGRLVAVSTYTAAAAESLHGVTLPLVIPNGIAAGRFCTLTRATDPATARRNLGLPERGPLVVTVGRLVQRKGVCWFAANVLPLLPKDVIYAVAGAGPEHVLLRALAAADRRIRILGEVDDATVDALYGCVDLFVAPNIPVAGSPEGFGIAPAEAAAAGVPVLVSELEGLIDMAAITGAALVRPSDACAWVEAVGKSLAEEQRERTKVRTWNDVANDYAEFFADIRREASRR